MTSTSTSSPSPLQIGWAEADITPSRPVFVTGQFHARISAEVLNPIKTTALALQSGSENVIFVCCDVVSIPDELRDKVRQSLREQTTEIDPLNVSFNATHTHTGPEIRLPSPIAGHVSASGNGVELDAMPVAEYLDFLTARLVEVIVRAWDERTEGSVAYGLDYAMVGRNRRWVNDAGQSTMYGLNPPRYESFRHIEGYEDHSLNLLATYDADGVLTGLVVNIPSPSQVSEHLFAISADYWCETRRELRARFGEKIHILSQCSAAGDLVPRTIFEREANARMLELKGRTECEEIAQRIAHAVEEILPCIEATKNDAPVLEHRVETLHLPANALTQTDVEDAQREAEILRVKYEQELQKLEDDPQLREQPRWYVPATQAFRRMHWYLRVINRYEHQKTHPTLPAEVHVVRLGDIVFATNPFEYYLDFGIQIKVRSPAIQTFLVQLSGGGTYVPSPRSVQGGGYGSVPASNPVGPQGGQILADETMRMIQAVWTEEL